MKISEAISKLRELIIKHGDLELYHEDNSCQAYRISDFRYDEKEEEIRVW